MLQWIAQIAAIHPIPTTMLGNSNLCKRGVGKGCFWERIKAAISKTFLVAI